MAKKIIWTEKATIERKEILEYWVERNKSKTFSLKLNRLFVETLRLLADFPNIGRKTDLENVRVKIVKDYLLFYEIKNSELIVLSIWDLRRDENKLKIK